MLKQALRKHYLAKRDSLTEATCAQFNLQLYHLFFASIDLSFVKVLHTFLPIARKKEPDTWMIIDRIRREFPHVRLSVPKINLETNQLEHFYFEGLHQLEENKWGIPEPKQGVPTPVEKIDMVLVPLLTFDLEGHRVGYGKGHYDRFLSDCRMDCKKMGISFFPPEPRIEDAELHDIKMNAVITPAQFFEF